MFPFKRGRVDCSLLSHGEWGWDVVLDRDGGFFGSRMFQLRAEARFTMFGRLGLPQLIVLFLAAMIVWTIYGARRS